VEGARVAEKIEVSTEQSPHRVAWELAVMIAKAEDKITGANVSGDRKYWLDLYHKCRRVVISGSTADDVLKGS
jgi:hypothetical protein